MRPEARIALSPSFICRPGPTPGACLISYGEGSSREELEVESPRLVASLIELRRPKSIAEVCHSFATRLEITQSSAKLTIERFIDIGLLVNESKFWNETHDSKTWNALGWRDALDFHLATRNMIWRHSYKTGADKPPIMTYRWGDKLIEPDRPQPTRREPIATQQWVRLPDPSASTGERSYLEALHRRRTCRHFSGEPIGLQQLSDALGHALRVNHVKAGRPYRAAPTYSLGSYFSIYVLGSRVAGLEPGIYSYDDLRHRMLPLKSRSCDELIVSLAEEQPYLRNVAAALIVSVNWDQYMWKYRFSRAYRLAIFEIAGLVQTLLISATGANLATFLTPAIDDSLAAETCGISDTLLETPLYIVGLGNRSGDTEEHIGSDAVPFL